MRLLCGADSTSPTIELLPPMKLLSLLEATIFAAARASDTDVKDRLSVCVGCNACHLACNACVGKAREVAGCVK